MVSGTRFSRKAGWPRASFRCSPFRYRQRLFDPFECASVELQTAAYSKVKRMRSCVAGDIVSWRM